MALTKLNRSVEALDAVETAMKMYPLNTNFQELFDKLKPKGTLNFSDMKLFPRVIYFC
jgi:hypothetical protein